MPHDPNVTEKPCTGCKEVKPHEDFCRDRNRRDGRASRCRACVSEAIRVPDFYQNHSATPFDPENYTEKRCPRCKTVKPKDSFSICNGRSDGRSCYCRQCAREIRLGKAKHYQNYEMVKRYGIGIDEFNAMHVAQGGVCALCREECIQHPRLSIDHCHDTGRVRGLLCGRCNQGLGLFRDNSELMLRAAEYLTEGGVNA